MWQDSTLARAWTGAAEVGVIQAGVVGRSLAALAVGAALAAGTRAEPGPTAGPVAVSGPAQTPRSAPLVRLTVERDGVYRVTEADLASVKYFVGPADLPRLRLRLRDAEQPLRVSTEGLGPRDGRYALDFVGLAPRGEQTHDDPYNAANVYRLDLAPAGQARRRYVPRLARPLAGAPEQGSTQLVRHYEENRKLMRFSGQQAPPETWFWELAMAPDKEAKAVTVEAARVDWSQPARLRVRLFGYSTVPESPDHTVALTWNGRALGNAVWDGQTEHVFEAQLAAGQVLEGANVLTLRTRGETTKGLDVVLLDWVELTYGETLRLAPRDQIALASDGARTLSVQVPAQGGRTRVFDAKAGLVFAPAAPGSPLRVGLAGEPGGQSGRFWAVAPGGWLRPGLEWARPRDLRRRDGADLIIATHRDFAGPAERLAARRRSEGLQVRVVEMADVYDSFSGGLLDPRALRDFVRQAWRTWKPRPRYLLLLGDASWDYRNRQVDDRDFPDHTFMPDAWNVTVPKIPSEQMGAFNDRLRVPTFQWQSPWGHAASDLYFALTEGDDKGPELAVGRLPAGTLEEAEVMVDKVLAHGGGGPRRSALFLTDEYEHHKAQCDRMAQGLEARGFEITKIYPRHEEKDNEGNSAAIKQAFDAGQALVVFAGHGGRYIWRTGPPDPVKNHDLFTLQHLDELKPTDTLPVVLSLTCYSAPFDHPTADSIGEKMLRLRDKGAVAVVASSWRNVPPFILGDRLLEALGQPQTPRLGDAFLAGQRAVGANESLHTYNLLGDPSMPFSLPPAGSPGGAGQPPAPPH